MSAKEDATSSAARKGKSPISAAREPGVEPDDPNVLLESLLRDMAPNHAESEDLRDEFVHTFKRPFEDYIDTLSPTEQSPEIHQINRMIREIRKLPEVKKFKETVKMVEEARKLTAAAKGGASTVADEALTEAWKRKMAKAAKADADAAADAAAEAKGQKRRLDFPTDKRKKRILAANAHAVAAAMARAAAAFAAAEKRQTRRPDPPTDRRKERTAAARAAAAKASAAARAGAAAMARAAKSRPKRPLYPRTTAPRVASSLSIESLYEVPLAHLVFQAPSRHQTKRSGRRSIKRKSLGRKSTRRTSSRSRR